MVTEHVLEREIKDHGVVFRAFEITHNRIDTIPIFSYGKIRVSGHIVLAQESTRVALHHIIAEAIEAHLGLHPLEVRRNSFLHVFGSVIKVSAATIIGACIATAAESGTIAG